MDPFFMSRGGDRSGWMTQLACHGTRNGPLCLASIGRLVTPSVDRARHLFSEGPRGLANWSSPGSSRAAVRPRELGAAPRGLRTCVIHRYAGGDDPVMKRILHQQSPRGQAPKSDLDRASPSCWPWPRLDAGQRRPHVQRPEPLNCRGFELMPT